MALRGKYCATLTSTGNERSSRNGAYSGKQVSSLLNAGTRWSCHCQRGGLRSILMVFRVHSVRGKMRRIVHMSHTGATCALFSSFRFALLARTKCKRKCVHQCVTHPFFSTSACERKARGRPFGLRVSRPKPGKAATQISNLRLCASCYVQTARTPSTIPPELSS